MTDYSRANAFNINNQTCPYITDLDMWGTIGARNARYFAITFWKCKGGTNCKSSWQLSDWATNKGIKFTTLNSYFDGNFLKFI